MESNKEVVPAKEHIDLENILCWYALKDDTELRRCNLAALPAEELILFHAVHRAYLPSQSHSTKVA